MKILKLDNVRVPRERDSGYDEIETKTIITSKDTLFKTYSETAVYYTLEEGLTFEEMLSKVLAFEFIYKVEKGGN